MIGHFEKCPIAHYLFAPSSIFCSNRLVLLFNIFFYFHFFHLILVYYLFPFLHIQLFLTLLLVSLSSYSCHSQGYTIGGSWGGGKGRVQTSTSNLVFLPDTLAIHPHFDITTSSSSSYPSSSRAYSTTTQCWRVRFTKAYPIWQPECQSGQNKIIRT